MSFYGSVYYQLIDTFYKMIVKNSGDNTYSFNDSLVNDSDKIATGVLDESPAVGRKGVFSLDSGNYWINFSKDTVFEDKDNDGEAIAAPYKIWHSKPHLKTEGEGEEEKILNPRVSGWDVQAHNVNQDGYGADEGDITLISDNFIITNEDYVALENGTFLETYPSYYDEAGHLIVEKTEPVLYRLPEAQNLFDEIGIDNSDRNISEFNSGNNVIEEDATAKGPSTKLTFTPGNDWIKLSGDVKNKDVDGEEKICGNIYRIWHDSPRENDNEKVRISGWDYEPDRYEIEVQIETDDEGNRAETEIKITDTKTQEVLYDRANPEQELGYIQLNEQDFIRMYPAYNDKAGHVFGQEPEGILYRLPQSAVGNLSGLVGIPSVHRPRWYDDIELIDREQSEENSIYNLYDYAEKNFENITNLRTKFGIINSEKAWDIEKPLSVLVGNKNDLSTFEEAFKDDIELVDELNILTAIADNRIEINAAEVFSDGLNSRLGQPITTGISAFSEIADINTRIGTKEDTSDKDTVYGAIKAVDEKAISAIEAERERAELAEKANADEIARVNTVLVDALENNGEGLDSIKELATWIENHGPEATAMSEAISKNEQAISSINNEETGILKQANNYTDQEILNANTAIGNNSNQIIELSSIVGEGFSEADEEGQITITSLTEMINKMNDTIKNLQNRLEILEGSSEEGTV